MLAFGFSGRRLAWPQALPVLPIQPVPPILPCVLDTEAARL